MQTDDVHAITNPALQATGRFDTQNGEKYVAQLCKHFAHKIETHVEGGTGTAALGTGPCTMQASPDTLRITVQAATLDGLSQAKRIIDSHLARFAFREGFEAMDWA
ncbi:DUF2218 domain-containing protein [Tropicibacter naphthalenivorans]|uniref:2,4-dihydroxyhept-2-ene-1,7-dioic acid aldolase n=1 Tax=Tropicibacter naphthalenivorans TaxID=441103 RepID=A0A0P1GK40_9RHOB|nr:DUF2218 domain-containing protein [Tropicibacter naphthalenivorans]CUH82532.1 hypothetical protein TRN7648_04074 [Tropicibacter naphthalenivorans]SMD10580.1 hypothetical protein SAMN04488093_1232 [Tropicibacter naphthalenivorans]